MDEKNKECKEYHVLALEKGLTILNSVYTRSGQNSTPNSNATNLHSSQKRCCSFGISSSNASPAFQVQKKHFPPDDEADTSNGHTPAAACDFV